eukprot:1532364-Alexandrium_andersonii.AAC.1
MSASLVGSEMCIRDRNADANPDCSDLATLGRNRQVGRAGMCAWVSQAVSYTHLTLPTICSV